MSRSPWNSEVREGLLALAVGTGLRVIAAMMEADVTVACGVIPEAAQLVKAGVCRF